jgi:hypothetical protein
VIVHLTEESSREKRDIWSAEAVYTGFSRVANAITEDVNSGFRNGIARVTITAGECRGMVLDRTTVTGTTAMNAQHSFSWAGVNNDGEIIGGNEGVGTRTYHDYRHFTERGYNLYKEVEVLRSPEEWASLIIAVILVIALASGMAVWLAALLIRVFNRRAAGLIMATVVALLPAAGLAVGWAAVARNMAGGETMFTAGMANPVCLALILGVVAVLVPLAGHFLPMKGRLPVATVQK